MTCYVDNPIWRKMNVGPRSPNYCHLTADSLEELHLMAEKVGLSRGSFQRADKYPHYDLTEERRKLALAAGATEVSSKELVVKAKFLAKEGKVTISKNAQAKQARAAREISEKEKRR